MGNKLSFRYVSDAYSSDYFDYTGVHPGDVNKQVYALRRERLGEDNPHFRDNIVKGVSATNSLRATSQALRVKRGYVDTVYVNESLPNTVGRVARSTYAGLYPVWDVYPNMDTALRADARNKAAIGILKRIAEESKALSGPTFLGELRQTVNLMRHPAKAMRDYTNDYLTGALNKRRKMSKHSFSRMLADSWLEYSFGVAPLMSDISAIATASLGKFEEARVKRISYTAYADKAISAQYTTGVGGVSVSTVISKEDITRVSSRFTVGYRTKVQYPQAALVNIVNQAGFSLDELVPTAWELLPWSFFIDYFSNIGDVLSTGLVSTADVAWTNRTERCNRLVRQYNSQPFTTSADTAVYDYSPGFILQTASVVEREDAPIPFPELRFELPGRSSQFLNLAALAKLQFSK